jgi:hypothetical protein
MRRRTLDNQGEAIGLFPFLAVLLCTMGALLVLLVILSQHIQRKVAVRAAAEAQEAQAVQASPAAAAVDAPDRSTSPAEDIREIAAQLELARKRQTEFEQLRREVQDRHRDEQLRLSHIEEHNRRLEKELALLHLAHEQLKATESEQSVDQEQARQELDRLRQIVADTEARLEELRKQPKQAKSFAIVPYRGPNGTHRQPIYVECTRDGIILQPEGIRLTPEDFVLPMRPGNPLASALRAAREFINQQAQLRGEPEPPDPYPLLLVRPDGTAAYAAALAAVKSWDASFGYEFVDADWQLEFGESDPQLAEVMHHSVEQARERQAMLAQLAPSRYRRLGVARGGAGGASGGAGSGGIGRAGFGDAEGSRLASGGNFSDGSDDSHGETMGPDQLSPGDAAGVYADPQNTGHSAANSSQQSRGGGGQSGGGYDNLPGPGDSQRYFSQTAGDPGGAGQSASGSRGEAGQMAARSEGNGQSASGGGPGGSSGGSSSGSGSPPEMSGSSASLQFSQGGASQSGNLAQSRGQDWAVGASVAQSASAVRRPIHVRMTADALAVLPSRHASDPATSPEDRVSLHQPAERVADDLVAALRRHMDDWGLAGRGLYWRPVLVVDTTHSGRQHAEKLAELLHESGIEVQLPEVAKRQEATNVQTTR